MVKDNFIRFRMNWTISCVAGHSFCCRTRYRSFYFGGFQSFVGSPTVNVFQYWITQYQYFLFCFYFVKVTLALLSFLFFGRVMLMLPLLFLSCDDDIMLLSLLFCLSCDHDVMLTGLNISTRYRTMSGKKSSYVRRKQRHNGHSSSAWS